MQASEMRFLRKIKGITMLEKHRNTAIHESFDIESLLLRIERSQLRWFGHVSRMPQKRLPKQTLNAEVSGRGQLEEHDQNGFITTRILVGTVCEFIQAKCSLCW